MTPEFDEEVVFEVGAGRPGAGWARVPSPLVAPRPPGTACTGRAGGARGARRARGPAQGSARRGRAASGGTGERGGSGRCSACPAARSSPGPAPRPPRRPRAGRLSGAGRSFVRRWRAGRPRCRAAAVGGVVGPVAAAVPREPPVSTAGLNRAGSAHRE